MMYGASSLRLICVTFRNFTYEFLASPSLEMSGFQ